MRPKSPLIRKAFTLIELLTVIAIIGILAGLLATVVPMVKKRANISASKAMFQQWTAAIEQYKSAYGSYPYLNSQFEPSKDTIVSLDSAATVKEFLMCMTGKQPIFDQAAPLSPADAKKYNKRIIPFCDFGAESFELDSAGAYTRKLTDRFGNTKIRIVMDTDGNGLVKPADITGDKSDYGLDSNGNVSARVIIYTLKSDKPTEFQDVLSWQ